MAQVLVDTATELKIRYFKETVKLTEAASVVTTRAIHGPGEVDGEVESSQAHCNTLKAVLDWFAAHGITPTP